MTFDDALARLNELKRNHLDEKVVEAFNRAYRRGSIRPGVVDDPAADEEVESAVSAEA
jgi:hypothetical protein